MMAAEKKYIKAKSVEEAIASAEENKSFRFVAGGTDVMVNKFQGNDEFECMIDISEINEFTQVTKSENILKIGALLRLDDLQQYPEIKNHFPSLLEAAHSVASPVIRKTATLGGNLLCENRCIFYNQSEWWRTAAGHCLKDKGDICIATGGKKKCFSKFVSDTAPVLIACNAFVEIKDENGANIIPLEKIYTGDGVKSKNLPAAAIITFIQLPINRKYKCLFKKLRPREAVDFTSLTTAVSVSDLGDIRIVAGGVDPKPVLIEGTISDKKEKLISSAVKKCRVIDNDLYSREYRREMLKVFLEESFHTLNQMAFP